MLNSHFFSLCPFALGLALLAGACTTTIDAPEVDGQQRDGVWVFTYADAPDYNENALGNGQATVVDDCLLMGDAVVVWYDHHLEAVDDIIARVQSGETVHLQVGGGGLSLDEGSTADDFPPDVLEHCSASAIWFAADADLTIEEDA